MTRFLIDTSAFWRLLRSRRLHDLWRPVVLEGDVRSCYPQRAEFLRSARDIREYEQYTEMFAELCDDIAVPKSAGKWIAAYSTRRPSMACAVRCRPSICRYVRPLRITDLPSSTTTTTS